MLFVLYTDFVAVMQTFYHLGNLAAVTGLQGLAAAAFPLFGIHDGDNCILGHFRNQSLRLRPVQRLTHHNGLVVNGSINCHAWLFAGVQRVIAFAFVRKFHGQRADPIHFA